MRTPQSRTVRLTSLTTAAALALTACGGTGSHDPDDPDAAATADSVLLENCGDEVSVAEPPERVVSLNQSSTEILLSLGLEDRMVGTATWTDPLLPHLEDAGAQVPRLAENSPSFETVLDAEPDFVTASFTSVLGDGGVASRDQFSDLGVGSYISPTDCEGKVADDGDGTRESPLTPDLLFREIRELAEIFDVPDRGEELVTDLEQRLDEASRTVDASGTTALFWFANSESPYMAGCCGAPGIMSEALGLENVFDDTSAGWPQIGWEVVADRNPDVLILGDLTRRSQTAETADAKIEHLESHPVTSEMDAVTGQRYITLAGAEMNPSIRTIYGTQRVADALLDMELAEQR